MDFSALLLTDARQQVLSPFLCSTCRSSVAECETPFLPAIDAMLNHSWMGSPTDPSSPAGISSALGYDLFTVKGLRPTPWESLKETVRKDGFHQFLNLAQTVLGAILIAAFLVYLGLN